jgi:putative SOS response-associated peptidase YedK
MCTLYNLKVSPEDLLAHFDAQDDWLVELEKDHVSPGRPGLVVTQADGARYLTAMRWGFPPPPGAKAPVVNVRNHASPFWRSALVNPAQRCLVPATGFSEWSAKQEGAKQRLQWFSIPSRPIFAFAGVWRPTETGPAFAFLTCEPNVLVGAIHPKAMPVILAEEDHDRWLGGDFEAACGLAVAYPSQLMAVA